MSDSGTWVTSSPACDCVCPLATLRIGYSERVDTGIGFSDWSPYDFTNVIDQSNTDPANGGVEVQVRVQFEITNPLGLVGVIRWSQVEATDNNGNPPETVYTKGETQSFIITTDPTGTVEYEFSRCAIGSTSFLIGAPARPLIDIIGQTQSAELRKKGFTRYLPDGLTVNIFREETASGGDPGCPDVSRLKRVYSGHQNFTAVAASSANGWLADPAGAFEDTRSPDLIADEHASTPFGRVSETVEFGTVSYAGLNQKISTERYLCNGAPKAKTLTLELSAPYSTVDLTGAVDAALDTIEGLGATLTATNGSCFHRKFLASDETWYTRTRTTSIRAAATPTITLATKGDAIDVRVSCVVLARSLTLPATVTSTPKIFTARLYAEGNFGGPFGRGTHQPDASAGETDVPPEDNPWEDAQFDGKEILLTKIKAKPHALMVNSVPFVELTSVLAEGVDGE